MRTSRGFSTLSFGFSGEQTDSESGLIYLRARYMDPTTGRFLNKDPANSGWTYGYANNNPTLVTDPTGMSGAICMDGVCIEPPAPPSPGPTPPDETPSPKINCPDGPNSAPYTKPIEYYKQVKLLECPDPWGNWFNVAYGTLTVLGRGPEQGTPAFPQCHCNAQITHWLQGIPDPWGPDVMNWHIIWDGPLYPR